ncbi:unnamed protein product [Urochloa decumbens]|uniref:F-box domain-containing protein n=1 Tax=Urochloa decumbens TaxID=240449 RepID=A0ABC9GPP8_9POAL
MPPPELSDDLVGEFLLRLPPDDPACLLRASLACKRWRRILADPAFRRRHRELHPAPSIVGFLRIVKGDPPYASRFVPNSPASNLPPARDLPGWLPYDCRHGRALFLTTSPGPGTELDERAALLAKAIALAPTQVRRPPLQRRSALRRGRRRLRSPPLPRGALPCGLRLESQHRSLPSTRHVCLCLGARRLSIVDGPPPSLCQSFVISFMSMGDGELRSMDVEDEPSLCLRLWSREAAPYSDGVARWTRGRAIELETLLPDGALPVSRVPLAPARRIPSVILLGFAEGTDVIFVGTLPRGHRGAVYMVQLNAGRARKVFDKCILVIPYTSFCIPVTDVASTSEGAREGVSSA